MTEGLTQAIDFALDVQQATQAGKCMKEAIIETLKSHPGAEVGNDIKFPDGSRAILTNQGFRVE